MTTLTLRVSVMYMYDVQCMLRVGHESPHTVLVFTFTANDDVYTNCTVEPFYVDTTLIQPLLMVLSTNCFGPVCLAYIPQLTFIQG